MAEDRLIEMFECEEYEIIEIYDTIVKVIVPKLDDSKLKKLSRGTVRKMLVPNEGTYTYDIGTLGLRKMDTEDIIEGFLSFSTKPIRYVYLSVGQTPRYCWVNQIILLIQILQKVRTKN